MTSEVYSVKSERSASFVPALALLYVWPAERAAFKFSSIHANWPAGSGLDDGSISGVCPAGYHIVLMLRTTIASPVSIIVSSAYRNDVPMTR